MRAIKKLRRKLRRTRPAPYDSSAMSMILPLLVLLAPLLIAWFIFK